jgi:hypothetical protein
MDIVTIKTNMVEEYLNSLTDQEKKTMNIAQDHLGTSFNILKSIGFIRWNEQRSKDSKN